MMFYPYDARSITPEDVRDWPNCTFLVDGALEGRTTEMGKFDGLPNVIFVPTKKSSGRGQNTLWLESELNEFKEAISPSIDAWKKSRMKYLGVPYGIGTGVLPKPLYDIFDKKIDEALSAITKK